MDESKIEEFKMAAIINLSENAWVKFFLCKWLNPRWQISRWLPSSSWVRMNKWTFFVQNGWIQDSRIQDGCHHLVSQIEFVWVRVRVEEECFWVNLREDNKVSESKMAVSESNMTDFKMAAIIKLSQNEQVKFFFVQNGWIQDGRIQDGCHHLVSQIELVWVRVEGECFRVNLREDNKVSESKMAVSESNMTEFRMAAIIKFSQNEWVKVFLCK